MGKRFFGCLLIILSLGAVALWFGVVSHDWNLFRLAKSFARLPHPAGTQHVLTYKELGLLVGNGNHCDYFVAEIRSFKTSDALVEEYYKDKRVWNPISHRMAKVELVFIKDGQLVGDVDRPVEDLAEMLRKRSKTTSFYIVYVLDPCYNTGLDPRCL